MSYIAQATRLGMPAITKVCTTEEVPVGTIVEAVDPTYGAGEFIFLQGVESTALGSFVTYNADDNSTTLLAANGSGPVAVAMAATVADTYGWYQISGKAVGKALTGFVDEALVYATATAGSVDDTVVAGDRVKRAVGASAVGTPSAGLAEFSIQRPFADDGAAA